MTPVSSRKIITLPKKVLSNSSASLLESRSYSAISSYNSQPSIMRQNTSLISIQSHSNYTNLNKSPSYSKPSHLEAENFKKTANFSAFRSPVLNRSKNEQPLDSRSRSPLTYQYGTWNSPIQQTQSSSVRSISITHSKSTQPPSFIIIDGVKHVKVSTTDPSNLQYVSESILNSKN